MLQHTNYISRKYRLKKGVFILLFSLSFSNLSAQKIETAISFGAQMANSKAIDYLFTIDYYAKSDYSIRYAEEHYAKVESLFGGQIFNANSIDNYSIIFCIEPLSSTKHSILFGLGGGLTTTKNAIYKYIDPLYGESVWQPIHTKAISMNFFTEYHYFVKQKIYFLFNMGGAKFFSSNFGLFHFNFGLGFKIYENKK